MNIKDLLEEDNFSCKKKGNQDGGVYGSACPWCGGDDRFRCWPYADNGGNYFCQKCGRKGSAVRYLVERRKMSYEDACSFLGVKFRIRRGGLKEKFRKSKKQWLPKQPDPVPSLKWQSQAKSLIREASDKLWNEGSDVRNWLHKRGLNDETIKSFKLGCIATDQWATRESWGLSMLIKDNGQPKKLWLPAGLVIPHSLNGQVQTVRIRRADAGDGLRYYLTPGSSSVPLILGNCPHVVIVESDLDAFLIYQEAGDLVTTVSLGSARILPDTVTAEILSKAKAIMVALDFDEAGGKSYWGWWKKHFPKSMRWPAINGKDPTEAHQNGIDIREWIIAGLSARDSNLPSISIINDILEPSEVPQFDDPESAVKKLGELKDHSAIIIDLSTTGANPFSDKIKAIQVYGENDISVCAEFEALTEDSRSLLNELLAGETHGKVFHDFKSQIKFLLQAGFKVNGSLFDTMLAAQILEAGIRGQKYDLASLASRHLSESHPCSLRIIKQLVKILSSKLKDENLQDTARLEFSCLPTVAVMELNGMLLDCSQWNELGNHLLKEKQQLEQAIYHYFGDIELDSPEMLLKGLKSRGIDILDTKRETFIHFEAQYPSLSKINEYRRIKALIHGYIHPIQRYINEKTGRIHAEYQQLGTVTGRFSCRYPNLQNIPRDKSFRSCFIPPPGCKLVIGDYSQMELRIAAEISNDNKMIQAFTKNIDLHKLTAAIVTGQNIGQVGPAERQAAKAVNFGLIFAMGAESLMNYARETYGVEMTLQNAQRFRERFFDAYKGLSEWHQMVASSPSQETRTKSNRRRLWNGAAPLTELLNAPIQGTASDILKGALVLLHEKLNDTGSKIIACIHDEIILETLDRDSSWAAGILEETMVAAGKLYLKKIPVEVEVSISDSWAGK